MSRSKIALAVLVSLTLSACGSSGKNDSPVNNLVNQLPNEVAKVNTAATTYVKGDGKRSISYVPEEKQELALNSKYLTFKGTSFVNNADDHISEVYVNDKNFTKLGENLFLVDENLEIGLSNYNVEYIRYGVPTGVFIKRFYNQPYSINSIRQAPEPWVETTAGLNPSVDAIEQLHKAGTVAIYKGKAFTMEQDAPFSYTVDFGNKIGYGEIANLNYGSSKASDTIKLHETALEYDFKMHNLEKNEPVVPEEYRDPNKSVGFRGKTDLADGNTYVLALKGPNAEEIVGAVLKSNSEYSVYSPTQDWHNTTEFNGRVGLAGCRDSELCK